MATLESILQTDDLARLLLHRLDPDSLRSISSVCTVLHSAEAAVQDELWAVHSGKRQFLMLGPILEARARVCDGGWLERDDLMVSARHVSPLWPKWAVLCGGDGGALGWAVHGFNALLDALAPRRFCVLLAGSHGTTAVLTNLTQRSADHCSHGMARAMIAGADVVVWMPPTIPTCFAGQLQPDAIAYMVAPKAADAAAVTGTNVLRAALRTPALKGVPLLVLSARSGSCTEQAELSWLAGVLGLYGMGDRPWRVQGDSSAAAVQDGFSWLVGRLREDERAP